MFYLTRHCGIKESSIHYIGGQFDCLLKDQGDVKQGTGEEQSLAVIHAFDEVSKAVRSLQSLPLTIHSVQGTHPVFRHADVSWALKKQCVHGPFICNVPKRVLLL